MISVIIPYHNSADYLEECIESVINQTYKDWELILIDDHSTDGSRLICEKYAAENKRIVLLDNPDEGVSAARNNGLKKSRGELIVFADSDDWLISDALDVLEKSIHDSDLVSASYCKMEYIDDPNKKVYLLSDTCLNKGEFIEKLFHSQGTYQGYCWGKMFRSEIIKEKCIQFDTSLAYNEDRLFVLEYTLHSKMVRTVSNIIYGYRQHSESAMSKAETNGKATEMKIKNEIQSAQKMEICLSGNFPKGQSWLEYNLLKKLYSYKKRISNSMQIPEEVKTEISKLENNLWNDKYIDLISKIKLLWNKMRLMV